MQPTVGMPDLAMGLDGVDLVKSNEELRIVGK